jgi:hypothetical protein
VAQDERTAELICHFVQQMILQLATHTGHGDLYLLDIEVLEMPNPADHFYQLLQDAKQRFEDVQKLITAGDTIITDRRMGMDIQKGMVDSVLFLCARAKRIARDDPATVKALGVDAAQFDAFMQDVSEVRNVAEHWQEVIKPRQPKPHQHVSSSGLSLSVEETSLIMLGPTEVYVSQLNVHDVYLYVVQTLEKIEAMKRSFWITSRDSAETAITPVERMRAANGIFISLNIIISPKGSGSPLPVVTSYCSSKGKNRIDSTE